VWRRAGHAGIAFKVAPAAELVADAPQNANARLQDLEAENRALRATIDKLTAQLSRFLDGY
jgi:peptidoglycan hydrolase CwlO-like protein